MVNELKLEELESVLNANKVVFIDFFETWCGPCRAMGPVVEELSEKYQGKVAFFKVDVDKNEQFAEKFGIQSIPCFFVIKNGKIQDKIVGMRDKSVLEESLNK